MPVYLPPSYDKFALKSQAIPNSVGKRIKYFRIKQEISQESLAQHSCLSVSIIGRYEQDRVSNPDPLVIQKIAKVLSIDPSKLVGSNGTGESEDFYDYFCPNNTFGSKLKKARLKQGIQQKDLAKMLGVNKVSVCRYEKDQSKPDKEIISKLSKILKFLF